MNRPPPGTMVHWRFQPMVANQYGPWRFGYCTYLEYHPDLVRMGAHNGDVTGGHVVSVSEIEWKEYKR